MSDSQIMFPIVPKKSFQNEEINKKRLNLQINNSKGSPKKKIYG